MGNRSIPTTCEHCQETFLAFSGRATRFCSRVCNIEWKKARPATVRFRQKVYETPEGCWLWTASDRFEIARGFIADIPRAAWLLFRGSIPDKFIVSSQCGNKECVNPQHLFVQKRPYSGKPLDERFWQKVKRGRKSECWQWIGARNPGGYGRVSSNNKFILAHRLSWALHNGPIPDRLWVLHRCDNPPCVNPNHLFLGTPTTNHADMVAKGRNYVAQGPHKITTEDAQAIIARRNAKEPLASIAKDFNVTISLISKIHLRKYRYLQRSI